MTGRLLAVDGGGTKTEFALTAFDGTVLRTLRLGPSNPFDIGFERTVELLRRGSEEILSGERADAFFAGLSGGGTGSMSERLSDAVRALFPGIPARADSDMVNAISSGSPSGEGCAVIAGTGSSAFARRGGALFRCGGWGHLFDGAGSGYDLGAGALVHTLRVYDGREEEDSSLARLTREALGGSPEEKLAELYAGGKRRIASFAPVVFAACDEGDPTARALVRRTALYLGEIVSTVCRTAGLARTPVVCIGGLWNRRDLLLPDFSASLTPGLTPEFPEVPPVFGAVSEAARLAGLPVTESFRDTFLHSWRC